MANLRRMFDILRLLVLHPIGSLEDRVHKHVDVLVDRAGDEEPPMFRVVRPEVGSASPERNAQRRSAEDDTHLAEIPALPSQSERPAASASRLNIWTVSSENWSRSFPSVSSFAKRSCVRVMMWQPIWSACTTLRISRGDAQINSEPGASSRMSTARAMIGWGS